jgi:MFS family permease
MIGVTVCKLTMDRYVVAKKATPGGMKPEHRLPPMIVGSICMPAGLLLYGWGAQYKLPWIVPVLGTGLIGIGLTLTTVSVNSYLVDAFSIYAASAVAASVISSCVAGALLPMAGPSLYKHLGIGWGNSLLAFTAVVFIPVPVLLMRFGERARNYSKFVVVL